jgi:hypothetical protein
MTNERKMIRAKGVSFNSSSLLKKSLGIATTERKES